MQKKVKIAITAGDPGGIGFEVVIKALSCSELNCLAENFIFIGNKKLLYQTSEFLGISLPPNLEIIDIALDKRAFKPGKSTKEGGRQAFLSLQKACELAKTGIISSVATAPVSKKSLNLAGHEFSGQTEVIANFFAQYSAENAPLYYLEPEMLFVAGYLRVMLLTRHIPIAKVSTFITKERIINGALNLNRSLVRDFKIQKPKIAMLGLNPHAGEDGLIGEEEIETILPALEKLKKEYSVDIEGVFPADALWVKTADIFSKGFPNGNKLPYDAYIACYHDQALIPVKMIAPHKSVNTTINLPIIRTSPAHGTAFDIMGKNLANPCSMIEAIKLAYNLA